MENNLKIQLWMVQACYASGDMGALVETVTTLAKKRSVVKQAITGMVQECMKLAAGISASSPAKFELIECIRAVTDGKIYVEVERARVTKALAEIREAEGRVKEAAELMQELQVETFGSMDRRERVDFILEQLRLLVAVEEWSKAQIVSRKIAPKALETEGFEDLRLRYYALMIQLSLHDRKYLEGARFHHLTSTTSKVPAEVAEHLKQAALLAVLAKHGNEQSPLVHSLKSDRALEESGPAYYQLLRLFLTRELIRWAKIDELFAAGLGASYVFASDAGLAALCTADLKDRVVEHNIRVVAGCYKRIALARLALLLDLSAPEAERYLCEQISGGMPGKIDRITGIVTFAKASAPEETLNQWAAKTDALLTLLVRTNHAISKEEMTARM